MPGFRHHAIDREGARYIGREIRILADSIRGTFGDADSPPAKALFSEINRLAWVTDSAISYLLERLEMREQAASRRTEREATSAARHERQLAELTAKIVSVDYESVLLKSFEHPFKIHSGCYVYILWGDTEVPVYVGKSTNVVSRIQTHLRDKQKKKLTKRIQLLQCENHVLMDKTEARLIRHYQPLLNKAGL